MWTAARLWDQRGDSQSIRRVAAGGYRFAVSSAAPPGKTEMDQGGMANLRKQAAGEVLSTDGRGKEATDQRTLEVVAAFGCNRRRAAAGRVNEDAMKEVKKSRGGRSEEHTSELQSPV